MNFFGKTLRKKTIRPSVLKNIQNGPVENKKEYKNEEKMDNKKIAMAEELITKTPKKVKVEKKEKGLYERAEVTVVTDDNKILLKD